MEVTTKNFKEVLPKLKEIISSSDFLAIDGEFTGLHSGQNISQYDCPAKQYAKLRDGGMNFLLVQFGLCAFTYDKEKDRYQYYAYNFYVFPKQLNRSATDQRFLCQSSSLAFLRENGFDFNKLFQYGVPYLTKKEEKRLRENIEEQQKARMASSSPSKNERIAIPAEHAPFIEKVCDCIKVLLVNDEKQETELPQSNAFVRKLLYQTVSDRFSEKDVYLDYRHLDSGERVLMAVKPKNKNEREALQAEKFEKELQDLDDFIGFSRVIQMISDSKKLIVGHNMLLDVCHSLHQFCDELPNDYEEFKKELTSTFPNILDTKYMSSAAPFKDHIDSNILGHLYTTLTKKPFFMPEAEAASDTVGYDEDVRQHEAAYDAYITGLCFISMANYLGLLKKPIEYPILSLSPLLKKYVNRLHLSKTIDSMHINLSGADPVACRKHVFHVSFPKEWKTSDLTKLFSPFGSVYISWLSDISALVALSRRDQADVVLKTMTQSDTCTVLPFSMYERHDDICIDGCIEGKKMLGCLKKVRTSFTVPHSPTADLLKRKSLELQQDDTPEQQDAVQTSGKRKRSHSFGESTLARQSMVTIVEEQECDDDRSDIQVNGSAKDSSDGSSQPKKLKPGSEKLQKNDCNNEKQFQECNVWE